MIIWINGPFGIGKTQTAFELKYRIPDSVIFDPEDIGFFLARRIPPEAQERDFQDYALWRKWVVDLLAVAQTDRKRVVIVPMTIVSRQYFLEIVDALRSLGIEVIDFTLVAAKETIEARLRKRFDGKSWNFHQIDRCLEGLKDNVFSNRIDTDVFDLYQVVEHILQNLKLEMRLLPGDNSRISRFCRRLGVLLSHIRIF